MRIATVRTSGETTAAIRVDSVDSESRTGSGTIIDGVSCAGELFTDPEWKSRVNDAHAQLDFDFTALAPVIPRPGKIICVGLNYKKHIIEMGRELPDVPTLFIKYPEALTGPFDTIHIPKDAASQLDAESELAIIIGTHAHRVNVEEAQNHILGYSVINDYTLRDWQRRTTQFHQGKSYYRTAGFGPWITTADSWQPGPRITAHWDDVLMQDSTTDDLIFDCATLVSSISQIYPLNPGDVIATGTPDGVGFARKPKRFIQSGETVTCTIDGLGFIANKTVVDD